MTVCPSVSITSSNMDILEGKIIKHKTINYMFLLLYNKTFYSSYMLKFSFEMDCSKLLNHLTPIFMMFI